MMQQCRKPPQPTRRNCSSYFFADPKRCLAASFRKSRDRWKTKAQKRNKAIKALTIRVRDLEASRQHHREQAEQFHEKLLQTEQKFEQLQTEATELRTQRDALSREVEEKKSLRKLNARVVGSSACP
jgi:chromosome segregation ATPase